MENKKEIVALLLPVLQATRNLSDLIDLTLDETTEIVTATFSNGATKRANVAADSGTSRNAVTIQNIQDKYNKAKIWHVKRYACGAYYITQSVAGKKLYPYTRMTKKRIVGILEG